MNLSRTILGKSAVDRLTETAESAVLTIGVDTLTRGELAAVGCYNFVAATRLSRVLNRELGVKGLRQVYEEVSPKALALPELGAISLAVLGAAFEAKKIGGSEPLESYVRRHKEKPITWHTIKEQARQLGEARRKGRSRRARGAVGLVRAAG